MVLGILVLGSRHYNVESRPGACWAGLIDKRTARRSGRCSCRAEIPVAESKALATAGGEGEAGVGGVDRKDMEIQMRPRGSGSELRRPVRSDRGNRPGVVDDVISQAAGGCLD